MISPQLQHRSSEESNPNALEMSPEDDLFDPASLQEWNSGEYYDSSSFMPSSLNDNDKHLLSYGDQEGSNKRQELASDSSLIDSGKKKPGRKPILNEPTTKRKAQNRAAQRAFRERKENHVKELETKVYELEQQNQSKATENDFLKAQIAKLQRDNSLSSSYPGADQFTFDFPPPTLQRHATSNASVTSPSSDPTGRGSDCPSLTSSNTSPQSIIEGDFNAAAMPFFARQGSYPQSLTSRSDHTSSGSASNGFRRTSGPSSLEIQANQPPVPQLFSDDFTFSTSKPLSFDPLSYRDSTIFENQEDPTLFDASSGFLEVSQLDPNLDFLLPFTRKADFAPETLQITPPVSVKAEPNPFIEPEACPEVWRRVTSHPKFPIFDLDELCGEFTKKASCSQSAKQNKDWGDFDQALDDFAKRQEKKILT